MLAQKRACRTRKIIAEFISRVQLRLMSSDSREAVLDKLVVWNYSGGPDKSKENSPQASLGSIGSTSKPNKPFWTGCRLAQYNTQKSLR